MAFVKLSGLISDLTGKLNGSYFSKKKGGITINTNGSKLTKADSGKTTLQTQQNQIGWSAANWQLLTAEQRTAWQSYASNKVWFNKAGTEFTPSGYEVYMSCNVNLAILGLEPIEEPVYSNANGEINQAGIGWNAGNTLIFKYPPASPTKQAVVVYASAGTSAGVKYPRGGYKKIWKSTTITSGDTLLNSAYKDVFGYEPINCSIFFKIKFLNPDNGEMNGSKLTKADSGYV